MRSRWRFVILLLTTAAVIIAIPATRTWALRQAGWVLVAKDPLIPSDFIVLTVDVGGAGVLEAIDLAKAGLSERVALFVEPPTRYEEELRRRGTAAEDYATRTIRDLRAGGIRDVVQIPHAITGTQTEGPALAEWCAREQIKTVIVIAAPDHTRRLRRVLHRAMKDHATRVIVHGPRFAEFDPDRWWQTRAGIRTQISETAKLLFDLLRHPLP